MHVTIQMGGIAMLFGMHVADDAIACIVLHAAPIASAVLFMNTPISTDGIHGVQKRAHT